MADTEERIRRISAHPGVIGVIVVNGEGLSVRSTMDNSTTVQYANSMRELTNRATNLVRDIDPSNDLQLFRIRTKRCEVIIAPDNDYKLMVIQSPSAT